MGGLSGGCLWSLAELLCVVGHFRTVGWLGDLGQQAVAACRQADVLVLRLAPCPGWLSANCCASAALVQLLG